MSVPLTDAPFGKTLMLEKVANPELALRLKRMGLFEGNEITRLEEEVLVQPVRICGPERDAVLGGGMGTRIVVRLDDGRKLPLVEMKPGNTGHIEGLTGGTGLSNALEILGLKIGGRISFIRKLPPMMYVTIIEKEGRIRLTEGMAAKIWGQVEGREIQFVFTRKGRKFYVLKLLGGTHAGQALLSRGIEPGKILVLEGVEQAQSLHLGIQNPLIISSRDGLRLFLQPNEGEQIFVREV